MKLEKYNNVNILASYYMCKVTDPPCAQAWGLIPPYFSPPFLSSHDFLGEMTQPHEFFSIENTFRPLPAETSSVPVVGSITLCHRHEFSYGNYGISLVIAA